MILSYPIPSSTDISFLSITLLTINLSVPSPIVCCVMLLHPPHYLLLFYTFCFCFVHEGVYMGNMCILYVLFIRRTRHSLLISLTQRMENDGIFKFSCILFGFVLACVDGFVYVCMCNVVCILIHA
uniref:Uncharacterized protein n=1 Tax=Cacopsylla melanoneura TaxID=428564 RepID=A0A8D8LAA1_9HEMI